MKNFYKILILLLIVAGLVFAFTQKNKLSDWLYPKDTQSTSFSSNSAASLEDYYQKAKNLAQNQNQNATTTFLAVGDIMLSRNVALTIQQSHNITLPFTKMADILLANDFNFGNLESPLAPKFPIVGGHSLIFGAASSSLPALREYKFSIVNLANNHAFDQGLKGIDYTIASLNNLAINHEGTGDNLDEAWQPAVISEPNGMKICFVGASFSSLNDGGKVTNDYVARIEDTDHLKTALTQARSECDFVFATMHAGIEYTRTPNLAQKDFAHEAINDGADIVIGAHPHWMQTIEKYNGKYIFYSLGNFIFDQEWSQDTKEGLTLKISVTKTISKIAPNAATSDDLQGTRQPATLSSIELIPVILENYSTPRPANAIETAAILKKINQQTTILYP